MAEGGAAGKDSMKTFAQATKELLTRVWRRMREIADSDEESKLAAKLFKASDWKAFRRRISRGPHDIRLELGDGRVNPYLLKPNPIGLNVHVDVDDIMSLKDLKRAVAEMDAWERDQEVIRAKHCLNRISDLQAELGRMPKAVVEAAKGGGK